MSMHKYPNSWKKRIIVKSSHEEGEFISNIFLRPKKDGSFRMILNLKDLNTFVRFHHFKMVKPVFSYLRELGHISSGYLDDSFLLGYSPEECQANIDDTLSLYHVLGFLPHEVKLVTIPTQVLHHLGFISNSLDMTVSISADKHKKLKFAAQRILDSKSPTIREVAQLIGMMVSCFPGVEYGELFYRQLEIEKAAALKTNNWDFEQTMNWHLQIFLGGSGMP